MNDQTNPFEILTGSDKLRSPRLLLVIIFLSVGCAVVIGIQGMVAGIGLLFLPFILLYVYMIFRRPILGLYTAIGLGFIILGSVRYIKGVQVGLAMDGILFLTYIALIFNKFHEKIDWSPAKKDITILATIWFGYSLFEFFNPEVQSREAWLAGMRGVSLYMFLTIPLVLLFITDRKKMDVFLYIWCGFSILASMKGIMQLTIGVDRWEKAWLDGGGAVTHIIFGKLRIFSFMSDAGQFGANQAYSGVVATIIGFAEKNKWKRIFYFTAAGLGFYGMFLSGTRGAISIPFAGFLLYSLLRKQKVVVGIGILLLALVYIFFKYTSIGQDNLQIRRMRSAFDPNDPSFQVRLANQKKLSTYLSNKPFGGGIGHAGVKAQRYLPNAFLSQVATDSWYVLLWAEQGIVGLALHLFILFYVVIKGSYWILQKIRNPLIKWKMAALVSGMFGVMVASYGNAVLGTLPTGLLMYTSMALLLNAKQFDDP
ncbi:MAG: O-antigen ligase family protein [Bacteroidetes bacterium]|nr:O-antigen ligase family protein [Bacteroidota bacterium]